MKLYVVEMLRWGDRENHSYVEGVYDSLEKAEEAGKNEREYRGGKYEWEIFSTELNKNYHPKKEK